MDLYYIGIGGRYSLLYTHFISCHKNYTNLPSVGQIGIVYFHNAFNASLGCPFLLNDPIL